MQLSLQRETSRHSYLVHNSNSHVAITTALGSIPHHRIHIALCITRGFYTSLNTTISTSSNSPYRLGPPVPLLLPVPNHRRFYLLSKLPLTTVANQVRYILSVLNGYPPSTIFLFNLFCTHGSAGLGHQFKFRSEKRPPFRVKSNLFFA